MDASAVLIEKMNRFDLIDINCGCPVPKIVRKGAGSTYSTIPATLADLGANDYRLTGISLDPQTFVTISLSAPITHGIELDLIGL